MFLLALHFWCSYWTGPHSGRELFCLKTIFWETSYSCQGLWSWIFFWSEIQTSWYLSTLLYFPQISIDDGQDSHLQLFLHTSSSWSWCPDWAFTQLLQLSWGMMSPLWCLETRWTYWGFCDIFLAIFLLRSSFRYPGMACPFYRRCGVESVFQPGRLHWA